MELGQQLILAAQRATRQGGATWGAAHAAGKGVEPGRLPEALARSRGARAGSPRVLSSRYGFFVGAVLARVGFALFQHYAHEP